MDLKSTNVEDLYLVFSVGKRKLDLVLWKITIFQPHFRLNYNLNFDGFCLTYIFFPYIMIAIFSDICYDFAQQPLLCCCRFCLDDRLRLEREVQFHENDISAEEETAVQSTRLQSENEQRWRKESAGSQKSKRKKEIIRIGRSNVAYFSMDFLYFYRRKRMKVHGELKTRIVSFRKFTKQAFPAPTSIWLCSYRKIIRM